MFEYNTIQYMIQYSHSWVVFLTKASFGFQLDYEINFLLPPYETLFIIFLICRTIISLGIILDYIFNLKE